ncbi:hypothetical protein GCM10025859_16060 [Alicyclobacillus fastidiosus]|nr:hypothetical protein GCM10025859_16060 [Alicyclobacillus fastidiosus]
MNYAILCMNLLTGILTARFLGPSQKGVYYAISSWVDMIGYLAGLGINQAFVWYYHGNVDRRKLFRRTLMIGLCSILVSSVIGGFLIWYPMHRLGHTALLWAGIGLAMLPIGTLYGIATTYLLASGNVAVYNRLRLIQSVSSTLGIVILAACKYLNLSSYLTCLNGTSLMASLLCVAVTIRQLQKEITAVTEEVPAVPQFMSKSLAYFLPSLSSLFNERLDQMICTLWLSQREIGLYGVSNSSLGVLGSLIGGFSTVFYPTMAQSDSEEITNKGNKAFRLYTLMALAAIFCVITLSPEVLRVMYGRNYVAAYPIVVGLAPVAVFSGLIAILYQGFFSAGKPSYALVSEIVGAVSGAILIWWLAPRDGAVGVAVANSISYVLDFAICILFWMKLGGKIRDLIPMWTDITSLWTASKGRLRALFA